MSLWNGTCFVQHVEELDLCQVVALLQCPRKMYGKLSGFLPNDLTICCCWLFWVPNMVTITLSIGHEQPFNRIWMNTG